MEEGASLVKLQPCPFCGSEARLVGEGGGYFVECSGCLVTSQFVRTKKRGARRIVIQQWNRRVDGKFLRVMDVMSAIETLWRASRDAKVPQGKIVEAMREITKQSIQTVAKIEQERALES
jgi:hypothetical protein